MNYGRKKIGNRFWKIYFILLTAAVVLATVYFVVFWGVMRSYEESRPETVSKKYIVENQREVYALLDTAVDEKLSLSEYDTKDNAVKKLYDKISNGSISLVPDDIEVVDDEKAYTVYSGSDAFARAVIAETGVTKYGFEMLCVRSFEILPEFISECTSDYDIVIPIGAELFFGEKEVGEQYRTDSGGRYPIKGVYENGEAEDHFCDEYSITDMISEPEIKVILNGQVLTEHDNISGRIVYSFPKEYYNDYVITIPVGSNIKINGRDPLTDNLVKEYDADYSDLYSPFDKEYGKTVESVSYELNGFLEEPKVTGTFRDIKLSVTEKKRSEKIHLVYGWLDSDTETVEIKVPTDSDILLNGKEVTADYLDKTEEYYNSEYFSAYLSESPKWNVYTISGIVGETEMKVTDANGVELSVLSDEKEGNSRSVSYLLPVDKLDDENQKFVSGFVKAYVNYISKGRSGIDDNLAAVLAYMKPGTQSYKDVAKSINAICFNSPYKSVTYNSVDATDCRYYGEGCFSCTVETNIDYVTAIGEDEHSDASFELYVVKIGGYYKIVHMNII